MKPCSKFPAFPDEPAAPPILSDVEQCRKNVSRRGCTNSCCVFVLQLSETRPFSEDDNMVPVLTSKKASEIPVNEVACILQVGRQRGVYCPSRRMLNVVHQSTMLSFKHRTIKSMIKPRPWTALLKVNWSWTHHLFELTQRHHKPHTTQSHTLTYHSTHCHHGNGWWWWETLPVTLNSENPRCLSVRSDVCWRR